MSDIWQKRGHGAESWPVRKRLRLRGYDYGEAGFYFITICTQGRIQWLGRVIEAEMHVGVTGSTVQAEWNALPRRFPGLELDQFVVMPNHVHGIVRISDRVEYHNQSTRANPQIRPTISVIVKTLKGATSYRIRTSAVAADFGWQKSYYDSIVRNEETLNAIRDYIVNNPSRWEEDKLYIGDDR